MKLLRRYFELTAWVTAILLLALMNPATDTHYSFCLFKFIGIQFCPGCGLGHSISYLFHGDFKQSFNSHPLGFFAVPVIFHRMYQLISVHFISKTKSYNYGNEWH